MPRNRLIRTKLKLLLLLVASYLGAARRNGRVLEHASRHASPIVVARSRSSRHPAWLARLSNHNVFRCREVVQVVCVPYVRLKPVAITRSHHSSSASTVPYILVHSKSVVVMVHQSV